MGFRLRSRPRASHYLSPAFHGFFRTDEYCIFACQMNFHVINTLVNNGYENLRCVARVTVAMTLKCQTAGGCHLNVMQRCSGLVCGGNGRRITRWRGKKESY